MLFSSDRRKTPRLKRPDNYGVEKKKSTTSQLDEAIVAIITPPGQGGVAALRIAGPPTKQILKQLFVPSTPGTMTPFLMRHGHIHDGTGSVIDEVLAVFMPAGKSYTGEDQAEIYCHGGRQVVQMILSETIAHGARVAEPGEFTQLAFLSGRIDLARAEAVAEMIAAETEVSLKVSREHLIGNYSEHVDLIRDSLLRLLAEIEASIDFSEEEIDPDLWKTTSVGLSDLRMQINTLSATYQAGRIIREGFRIVICGRSNAGKSSLFNLLLEQERALVDPEAGTTRDYLSEWIDLDGFAVNITDTAGFRDVAGSVERQGQDKAHEIINRSDLLLWMADCTAPDWLDCAQDDMSGLGKVNKILIGNKIDLVPNVSPGKALLLSCVEKTGLKELRATVLRRINELVPNLTSGYLVTSARHRICLEQASEAISQALEIVEQSTSPEIVAFELRRAAESLGEITGKVYTEEILGEIFSRFCIGK